MKTLPWDKARKELSAIDPQLAAALTKVHDAASSDRRAAMTTSLASYAYGDALVRQGAPLADDGAEMPAEFVLETKLPLGIIMRNGVEVMEAVVGKGAGKSALETRLVPQALLGPKRLIGVFELLDLKSSALVHDNIDWNITAGTRSLYATKKHFTKTITGFMHSKPFAVPRTSILDHRNLYDWLSEIPAFKDEIKPAWRVNVLYFAREWFSDGVQLDGGPGPEDACIARELYHQLLERAWPTLSRLRPNSATLYDLLREAGNNSEPAVIEAAFQLLEHASAARGALRPCFSPAMADEPLGPFGAIVSQVLTPALGCGSVLRPTYLSNGHVGYLKLSHIAPALFSGSIERNFAAAIRLIRTATESAIALNNKSAERALGWPELFNDLMFRYPAASGDAKKPKMVRFTVQPHNVAARKPQYDEELVNEAEFFSSYQQDELPQPRCEFFTGSIRIAASNEK